MLGILKKLLHILNKNQKRRIVGLGFMIFIGALMEMIGVGLIMPVVEGVISPESLMNKSYIRFLGRFFTFDTPEQWLLFLIVCIILVYFVKNGYLLLQTYVQSRFVNQNQSRTISYMLEEYLNRPYEFYLNADIPTIFRTIDGDVPKVFTTLMEYIQLATELMVSAVLCITLLVTNPGMTLMILVIMGGGSLIILKVLKPTLNRLGRTSQRLQSQMGKWRLQSIYGIKDVKILNKEHYFASNFGKYSQRNAKLTTEYTVLNNVPRLLLETLSITGILGYLAFCILGSADMTELVPQISAFAVAAMRLLPSVNRINTHMSNIAFYEPAVNYVYENVDFTSYRLHGRYEKEYDPHTPPMELKREIRMENVRYVYPESDKVILDQAQMLVPVGKSVGVMGPSGAGKSTAIDVLMGLLRVQSGKILCDSRDIFENYPSWLSHIGYIPQNIYLTDDSIRENIAFGVAREDIDNERVWQVLEEAQLKDFVKTLPGMLEMEIGDRGVRLSGGQRQRLGIARALYHNPDILVFDEATSALDTDTETAIMEAIESFHGKKTLIIIAHRLRTIANCDIIYKVDGGKIVQTTLAAEEH
ncbi:MAG: ABC transporter ATP-binding protein [Eubacteriales bacterium]|nr:ABC transporter ATP-binding protein [Eubacteriales bacterium]